MGGERLTAVQDRIEHAKSYPFPSPDHSFVYENGDWRALGPGGVERDGRHPVLAAGSNQSPEQLNRKYGDNGIDAVIPVQRGRLHDFDVVYAGHLTAYGSVPATFQHSPRTVVDVFVLWLDDAQLARMHETEGNYTYDHLSDIRLELDGEDQPLAEAYAYTSRVGCLNFQGACVSLKEIEAQGRVFPALDQIAALGMVRDRFAPGIDVDEFVRQHLDDRQIHRDRSTGLGSDALPVAYQRRVIAEF